MPNSSDKLRDKLYDDYEDSLFRLVMHEVAVQDGLLFLKESETLKTDPAFSMPEDAVKRFEKQLRSHLKKSRPFSEKRVLHKVINRAAAVILVLVVAFSVAMVSAQAFRVKVLNLLIDIQDEYTSFQLDDSGASGGGKLTVNDSYMPSYVPEGFEIDDMSSTDNMTHVTYQNADGKVILYGVFSSGTNLAVDSENASRIETIEISGNTGTLIVKSPLASVVWEMDGRLFLIQGEISPEEAVEMAKSIESAP